MAWERVKTPKAVPRRSEPAMIRAEGMLGAGLGITAMVKASHWFLIFETSSLLDWARESMRALFPKVPMRISGDSAGEDTGGTWDVLTVGLWPVTRWMSSEN